jgi:carboxylesterase type B
VDKKVSDAMSSYWVNFAAKGDPNGAGLSTWPPYNSTAHKTMELGAQMGAMSVADPSKLEFFLRVLKK